MIYKWNELDYYHFNEFLQKFEEGEEWTRDKVLEIQDPIGIMFGKLRRVFLGRKIKLKDFEEYNNLLMGIIHSFSDLMEDMMTEDCVSMCMLSEDSGPRVIPLVGTGSKSSFTYIRHTLFGDFSREISEIKNILKGPEGPFLWYEKGESGDREVWIPSKKEQISDTQRFVRFRTMDYEDWEKLMKDWLEDKESGKLTEKDLAPEDFKVMPESARVIYNIVQENGGFDKIFGNRD